MDHRMSLFLNDRFGLAAERGYQQVVAHRLNLRLCNTCNGPDRQIPAALFYVTSLVSSCLSPIICYSLRVELVWCFCFGHFPIFFFFLVSSIFLPVHRCDFRSFVATEKIGSSLSCHGELHKAMARENARFHRLIARVRRGNPFWLRNGVERRCWQTVAAPGSDLSQSPSPSSRVDEFRDWSAPSGHLSPVV